MTTPDDRFRPGPHPGRPDDAPAAPSTWSVGGSGPRPPVPPAPGPAEVAPAGPRPDVTDLDGPTAPGGHRARRDGRGRGLLAAALFTTAGAVVLLALAVGALAVAVWLGSGLPSSSGWTAPFDGAADGGPRTYGDDPDLDELWDACGSGEGGACNDLYAQTPAGSGYETFGWTCGERYDLSRDPGTCPADLG